MFAVETTLNIRWMIRRDMPAVLAIENQSFEFPWTEEDFIRCLRCRNVIGMVIEAGEDVVGFMIYELFNSRIRLVSLAVAPSRRRLGYGTALLDKLWSRLHPERRNRIVCTVRETNLDAQYFLRSAGFRAISVLRGYYGDSAEDAYLFRKVLSPSHISIEEGVHA